MAVATSLAIAGGIAAGAGALAGAIGGAVDKKSSTRSGITLAGPSANEIAANQGIGQDYGALRGMVDAGPGASDVSAGTSATRDLASMLAEYQKSGGMASGADFQQANTAAGGLFQGQRQALMQNFMDQETQSRQNAAVSGRGLNDPVLRNKLMQEQTRQQMQLDANQGSLAQQLAMALPGQKLNFANQRTNVLQGLASQAMSNRQALLSMGEGIQTNERNFRLSTGERWGEQTQHGSIGQAIAGGMAGLGSGMSAAAGIMGGSGGLSSLFGGGGGGGGAPAGGGGGSPFSLGVNYNMMPSTSLGSGSSMVPMPSVSPFNVNNFGRTTAGSR